MQGDNGQNKLDMLSTALVMNVEEKCLCGFSQLNILEPRFHCFVESENAVTYRTELIATGVATLASIATHIQVWITQGAQITVDSVLITIDSYCQVIVTSVMETECSYPTSALPTTISANDTALPNTTEDTVIGTTSGLIGTAEDTVRAVIGGVVGAVLLLGIVGLVAIVPLSVWMYRKRKHIR